MSKRKFQAGDHAFINDKLSVTYRTSFNIQPGDEVIITGCSYNSEYLVKLTSGARSGQLIRLYSTCLDKAPDKTSIDKFQSLIDQAYEKIEKTKNFIVETEAKIAFLKEIGSDTFDENEFKAFHTLTIIEHGNMSKIEKAKAIAALISQK